ncbi:hypothetical protein TNCV_2130951 [Trichonephila clavipes]|nr:hypothetical protein TNCV_2130951 [Trichonephila clavipes]
MLYKFWGRGTSPSNTMGVKCEALRQTLSKDIWEGIFRIDNTRTFILAIADNHCGYFFPLSHRTYVIEENARPSPNGSPSELMTLCGA